MIGSNEDECSGSRHGTSFKDEAKRKENQENIIRRARYTQHGRRRLNRSRRITNQHRSGLRSKQTRSSGSTTTTRRATLSRFSSQRRERHDDTQSVPIPQLHYYIRWTAAVLSIGSAESECVDDRDAVCPLNRQHREWTGRWPRRSPSPSSYSNSTRTLNHSGASSQIEAKKRF